MAATADALRKALPPESHILEEFMKRRAEEQTVPPSAPAIHSESSEGWEHKPTQDDEWVTHAIDAAVRSMDAVRQEEPIDELDDRVASAVTRQYFKSWPFYLAIGLLAAALSLYGIQVGILMVDVKQMGALRDHAIEEVNKAKAEIQDKTAEVDTQEKNAITAIKAKITDVTQEGRNAITDIRKKIPEITNAVGSPESIRQEVVKVVVASSSEAIKPDRDKLSTAYQNGTTKVNEEVQKLIDGLPRTVADLAKNVQDAQAKQATLELGIEFAKKNTGVLNTLLDRMKISSATDEQWVPTFLAKSFQYSTLALGVSLLMSLVALVISILK